MVTSTTAGVGGSGCGRVHDFRRCAPGLCTFFLRIYHYYILGGCMEKNPGCTVLGEVYPVGASNKTLISNNVNFRGVHRSCVRQGPRKCCEKAKGKGVRGCQGEGRHIIQ